MSLGLLIDPKIMNSQPEGGSSTDWRALVANIRDNDSTADQELHRMFSDGIRFFLKRSLGSIHLDARVRETLLIVKTAVRADEFIPETLASTVRTIVEEQVAKHVEPRNADFKNPAEQKIHSENVSLMATLLKSRSLKDRDALVRFYVNRQAQAELCTEIKLDEKDFELMKSGIRVHFEEAIARRRNDHPSRN